MRACSEGVSTPTRVHTRVPATRRVTRSRLACKRLFDAPVSAQHVRPMKRRVHFHLTITLRFLDCVRFTHIGIRVVSLVCLSFSSYFSSINLAERILEIFESNRSCQPMLPRNISTGKIIEYRNINRYRVSIIRRKSLARYSC